MHDRLRPVDHRPGIEDVNEIGDRAYRFESARRVAGGRDRDAAHLATMSAKQAFERGEMSGVSMRCA